MRAVSSLVRALRPTNRRFASAVSGYSDESDSSVGGTVMSTELAGKPVAFLVAPEGAEQVELTEPWKTVEQAAATRS